MLGIDRRQTRSTDGTKVLGKGPRSQAGQVRGGQLKRLGILKLYEARSPPHLGYAAEMGPKT